MLQQRIFVCVIGAWLQSTVFLCGCAQQTATSETNESKPSGAEPEPPPLFDGWKKPAFVVAITGEQLGYLEPCGCSANQSGGISRRANLFQKIDERKWPYVAVDLGGTIKRTREQSQYKFQTSLNALADMNYRALGLGPQELRLGAPQLLSLNGFDADNPDGSLAFLSANVVLFGSRDIAEAPKQWKVVTVGGVKIGITSILGASYRKDVLPQGQDDAEIAIEAPEAVLPGVIQAIEQQNTDLLVLLSHAPLVESQALAQKFPQFDLIVSAGGAEDPIDDNPQRIGSSTVVLVGKKGKYVGVVGYFPEEQQRFRFELVELDQQRFTNTPKMHEHMRSYQDLLRELDVAANEARDLAILHPSGSTYVGAEKCAECHTAADEKWRQTPHFHAYDSLIEGRKGQEKGWISRIYDPECLACHVVGWHPQDIVPFKSGFVDKRTTPGLLGVQCENCHGPGSRHVQLVEDGELVAARKLVKVTLAEAKDKLCYGCHDLDNSPGFKFEEFWPRIAHPGLD